MTVRRTKKPVQQELFRHGGRRKGAGRKPSTGRSVCSHRARPRVDGKMALHVVVRAGSGVGNLRQPNIYGAVREATLAVQKRGWIRIVHLTIQHNHIHLLVEAESKQKLAQGMLGFLVSAARRINRALDHRHGKVFDGRYHLVVIGSPSQARHALCYVLNNARKHGADLRGWMTDPYSSGRSFAGWLELERHVPLSPNTPSYGALAVSPPRSWLLRTGWRCAGTISAFTVPRRSA